MGAVAWQMVGTLFAFLLEGVDISLKLESQRRFFGG